MDPLQDISDLHQSVLLEESVAALVTDPDGIYIDGTFGRGGHSRMVLARLSERGRLVAIDRDPRAVEVARSLAEVDSRFSIFHGPFGAIRRALSDRGVESRVNGILLDIGVSSPQLDTAERGFSFSMDGPLDMRMDPTTGESAADWLARAPQAEIQRVLSEFGEERFSKRIARAIVEARVSSPIVSTTQLAELTARAVPTREPGKHPATRTFQALRIQVNDELNELRRCLDEACDLLLVTGRLVVISFHSLEDRIVKQFIRREAKGPVLPKGLPVPAAQVVGRLRAVGKSIRPSEAELVVNPRARSAIMRVAERLAGPSNDGSDTSSGSRQ